MRTIGYVTDMAVRHDQRKEISMHLPNKMAERFLSFDMHR